MARAVSRALRTFILPGLAVTTLALYVYASLFEATSIDRTAAPAGDEAFVTRKSRHQGEAERRLLATPTASAPAPTAAVENYVTEFALSGFSYSVDGDRRPVRSPITWSVVASLSPSVEVEARDMFQDSYGESGLHALGGGLIRHPSTGRLLLAHRLWLDNYYSKKHSIRSGEAALFDVFVSFRNSWHENYLLYVEVDDGYRPLAVSRILEIPTPTNLEFYEESDGPMGPKFVDVGGNLYLTFYTWARQRSGRRGDAVSGRTHVWDLQRKVKVNLRLNDGVDNLGESETGWAPLAKNGSLYFVRSFEPLRVLHCRLPGGDCRTERSRGSSDRGSDKSAASPASAAATPPKSASGTALVEYAYPYYVGVLHEPLSPDQESSSARLEAHLLAPRLVVLCVEPWHVAYVSEPLPANGSWLRSAPVVRRPPPPPFWHPTAVLLRDDDTLDMSAQLSDNGAHVVRLRGLRRLLRAAAALSPLPLQQP